ncbi:MAG: damage-inducible protein DinB [Zetaproteobacteria bacterium CG_4_9_14_3_um_filter_49_83]|nr:MAG: damage-inducible protein DinB [Zetaproteobacteria bacterium CG1_02_49_23]PIQ34383.1 MAG: damage-inducible protein DinB [Zetaproteobacteria bacterium CG17_big_fil_post_rev_8_21_14_2_50_50_13]PIV30714.1 MAG: damage-inducible protein DinB [Zetaproteobacteria bacterium CG02_land_8_20_14_3_00_50_9]PIY57040.1 MAG: damage-inducible protein DinB [Zetaproteobacteria bacterium CG_4_10_14_0_8_um_filter_49_80]PJA33892.1 MAG: damage-inducible protein DinB [Zetaproteobacteria bacterium CG_4_9_14_3_um
MLEYLQRMARYNQWMNRKLYAKVQLLSADEIAKDRGAFFDSIPGTLNHLLVADMFWLRRFAGSKVCAEALAPIREMVMPGGLRDILYDDIGQLASKREELDQLILAFSQTWSDEMLGAPVRYRNMAGEKHERPLGALLQHLFNHQTHHRGQVTTMLFQAGIDPEATDLLVMLMEE